MTVGMRAIDHCFLRVNSVNTLLTARGVCGVGGGGTSLYKANGDVPLDGVAFSRLA